MICYKYHCCIWKLVWGSLCLINREAFYEKRSKISNIPYNLIFTTHLNDSLILITIISCEYLNLSLANEYAGDVTISTQVMICYKYHCCIWKLVIKSTETNCIVTTTFNNLIWGEYCNLLSNWLMLLEEILVILDNLGWYCDVTSVFIRQQ
jgi:hypothetical protein